MVSSGWDDVRHGCASVPWVAYVFGLEGSGMALASIPCLACVNGLDGAGNGSGEHSVGGLREWA